jgi:hypothetical protein
MSRERTKGAKISKKKKRRGRRRRRKQYFERVTKRGANWIG